MDKYRLPKNVNICGTEIEISSDYRDILYIFQILNDPDLLDNEKLYLALENFYLEEGYEQDLEFAIKEMFSFIQGGNLEESNSSKPEQKPLFDWEQDFKFIAAPINRILGTDIRGLDYLHWWTFLSAFMEIGECTFNTYVGIRDKLNKHKKLDKDEQRIYNEHREDIVLKKKVDKTTQAIIDEIMGV